MKRAGEEGGGRVGDNGEKRAIIWCIRWSMGAAMFDLVWRDVIGGEKK